MAKYLISFPSAAMVVPDGERGAVGRDAHAVIDEAKAAGVYVFGGGIDEDVPPVRLGLHGLRPAAGPRSAQTWLRYCTRGSCSRRLRETPKGEGRQQLLQGGHAEYCPVCHRDCGKPARPEASHVDVES
jgi:hypothetical protein